MFNSTQIGANVQSNDPEKLYMTLKDRMQRFANKKITTWDGGDDNQAAGVIDDDLKPMT